MAKQNEYNGCGDASCKVAKPKKQKSDGGCRCYRDNKLARKAIIYQATKIKDLEKAITELKSKKKSKKPANI